MGLTDLKLEIEIKVTCKPMHLSFKEDDITRFEQSQDIYLRRKFVRWAGDKDLLNDWIDQAVAVISDHHSTTASRPQTPDIGEVSNITSTGATINATVDTHGESSQATVCYSLLRSDIEEQNDTVSAVQSPLTSNGHAVINAAITGLAPNTRYYYRWTFKSADHRIWTELQSFKTLPS